MGGGRGRGDERIVVENHLNVAERELAYAESTAARRREHRRDRTQG
jgi:hypothetical protein